MARRFSLFPFFLQVLGTPYPSRQVVSFAIFLMAEGPFQISLLYRCPQCITLMDWCFCIRQVENV